MEKLDPGGFTCTVMGHLRMGAGLREAKGREWRAGSELECPPGAICSGPPSRCLVRGPGRPADRWCRRNSNLGLSGLNFALSTPQQKR